MAKRNITLPMAVRGGAKRGNARDKAASPKLVEHLKDQLGEWQDHRKVVIEAVWELAHQNFNGEFDNDVLGSAKSTKSWRSKAFYPLTEQKVTAAQSQLQDILFKGGRFPYDIKMSPIPDDPSSAVEVQKAADPMQPMSGAATDVQRKAMSIEELTIRIKNMKKRIDDQVAECDASSVGLLSIFDGALYGTAFLEAPQVVRKKRYRWDAKGKGFTKSEV